MKKLALVTGVDTSSIAKSICAKFLTEGYEVILTYENKFVEGGEERTKLEQEYRGLPLLRFEEVNFRSKASVNELLQRLRQFEFDAIINCAASLALTESGELRHEFADFDYDAFNNVLQYNITTIAAISIGLKDNIAPGGVIINVTSSAAEEGAFATISYNASKAAVKNLTQSLANNFGGYNGIRVNSVAPGWIPPSSDVAAEGIVALANAFTPNPNRGRPEDVANAVFYYVSAPFVNGASFEVDGGITSSYFMYLVESLELQGQDVKGIIDSLVSLASDSKKRLGKN